MKKILLASGLAVVSSFAAAEEVGKVISSTPVTREVVQQNQCAPDAGPRDACRSVTKAARQTVGYKVVYEYAGKRYTTQMAEKPGATVSLQITPTSTARATKQSSATAVVANTEPIYEDRWDADRDRPYREARSSDGWDADRDRPYRVARNDDEWDTYRDRVYTETYSVQPRYTERVYVQPSYYPSSSYYSSYPSYYGSSYLPLLGLAIGYSHGFRGYNGHYGHRNHYGNHGNYGHRGHHRHGGR